MEYDLLRESDLFWVLYLVKRAAISVALQDRSLLPEPYSNTKRKPKIEVAIAEAKTGKSIDVMVMFYCWGMAITSVGFVWKIYHDLKDSSDKQEFRVVKKTRRTETVHRIHISRGAGEIEREELYYEISEGFDLEYSEKK